MNITSQPNSASQEFDIHAKLKAANSHWLCRYAAQPFEKECNFRLVTIFDDVIEFAIYERIGNYFILVDFFMSYDDACDDAKKIIDNHPDIKKTLSSRK